MSALRVLMATVLPRDLQSPRGGIEAAALQLVRALSQRQDVKLDVAAFHSSVTRPTRESVGPVRVWWLPRWRRFSTLLTLSISALQLRLVEKRLQPDLLHAQGPTPFSMAARWSRKPLVLTVHGLEMLNRRVATSPRRRLAKVVLDLSLDRANGVVCISPYTEQVLGRRLERKHRVRIDNPVSPDLFDIPPLPGRRQLLCVASISPLKNQALLARAFSASGAPRAGWQLVLAGPTSDTQYERSLESTIRRLGISSAVRLTGSVGPSELRELYSRSDGVLLASLQETAPMAIAEAMAAGRPVIATDVGGVRWMVADGVTGFLVPLDGDESMTTAIRNLATDTERRAAMSRCGRMLAVERFMPQRVAAKTVDFYHAVAGSQCAS